MREGAGPGPGLRRRSGPLSLLGGSLALGGLLFATAAEAQMTGNMAGSGTCSGTLGMVTLAGTTSIAIGEGNDQSLVPAAQAGAIIGRAECECQSQDIFMRIQLTTPAAPGADFGGMGMYVGNTAECVKATFRQGAGNPICDESLTKPPADSFRRNAPFLVSMPSHVITSPKPRDEMNWTYACADTKGPQTRNVMITLGPDSDMPASCTLPLSVNTTGPVAEVTLDGITSGNGALGVSWSVPEGTVGIDSYQVLCRKKSDPKVPIHDEAYRNQQRSWFSACIDGMLYRRPVPGRSNNMNVPRPGLSTSDMSDFRMDPRFICSGRIMPTTNSLNTRIEGLNNNEVYQVMVVAIDTYGNPKPSMVMEGTPLPTQNPIETFCDSEGNCPTGFGCSVAAGRAPASSPLPVLGLLSLSLLGLGGLRRRLAARRAEARGLRC
jgi:hypothetical protein